MTQQQEEATVIASGKIAGRESRFREGLRTLDQRIDWIPMGWQRLYGDMRSKLRSVECATRNAVMVHGAYEQDGYLHVEAVTNDKVVQGILRKARSAAAATCMACGRRGKPREFGDRYMSLCGSCAGCVGLREEVLSALVLLKRSPVDVRGIVGSRNLLAAAIGASLGKSEKEALLSALTEDRLGAWLRTTLDLLDAVVDGAWR
jgi:hypothetical protein